MARQPMRNFVFIASISFAAASCSGQTSPTRGARNETVARFKLVTRATIDVPATAPEIVSVSADRNLVLATDSAWKSLEIFALLDLETTPRLDSVDVDPGTEGLQNLAFDTEPTSVAAHPTLGIAFVVTIGADTAKRGLIRAIDLRAGSEGAILWSRAVGHHPDSVAVSRDGRWIVVANEGEGDDRAEVAPGSISVFDMRGLDWFAADASETLVASELDPSKLLGVDAGRVEPEYVAIDPLSRFAVVTCQENDAAVIVDLRGEAPKLVEIAIRLPSGAQPDGVAVLDDYVDPVLGRGALIGFAEEGDEKRDGRWPVQALGLWWFDYEAKLQRVEPLGRVDLVKLLGIDNQRAHPESVAFVRRGEHVLCAVGVERADAVLLFDVTNARAPRFLSKANVGKRPEGLTVVNHGARTWLITGDEGNDGPGEISVIELTRD